MLISAITILLSPILYAIFALFWGIFISFPFLILQGLFKVARFFGFELINYIIFKVNPGEYTFSFSDLPAAFLAFLLYGLIFTIIFIIISFAKYQIGKKNKNQNVEHLKFKNVLKQSFSAFLWALLLPFLIFVSNIVLAIIFYYFGQALELQTNMKGDIISLLYVALNDNAEWAKESVAMNNFAPMPFSDYVAWLVPTSWPLGLMFIKNTIISWICVIMLGSLLVNIVKNCLNQFTLFMISPLVAAKSVEDNGKAIMNWKHKFVESVISIFISLFALNFFAIFILILLPIKEKLTNLGILIIPDLVIYIGAAYATKALNKLIGDLLDIQVPDLGFKQAGRFIRTGAGIIAGATTAGAAVAAGNATLGSTISKGGFSNAIGGSIGKAVNISRIRRNKAYAKDLGMNKEFIKSSFENVGKNKVMEQRKMLNNFKNMATDEKGNLHRESLYDLDSLKQYKASELQKFKDKQELYDESYKFYKKTNTDSYLEQKRAELEHNRTQNKYKYSISKAENQLKQLNDFDLEKNDVRKENEKDASK